MVTNNFDPSFLVSGRGTLFVLRSLRALMCVIVPLLIIVTNTRFLLQVNMKMREITEREHKVKHHPLESPSHQKVKPDIAHFRVVGKTIKYVPLLFLILPNGVQELTLLSVSLHWKQIEALSLPSDLLIFFACSPVLPSLLLSLHTG